MGTHRHGDEIDAEEHHNAPIDDGTGAEPEVPADPASTATDPATTTTDSEPASDPPPASEPEPEPASATPALRPRSVANEGPGAMSPRPPRPAMSLETPAPMPVEVPRTKPVAAARILWFVSMGLAVAFSLFAGFSNGARRTALEGLIAELATGRDAETVSTLASLLFWGAFVGFLVVAIAEFLVASAALAGRGRARWALIAIVLVPHVAAWLAADAFIAIDDGGVLLTVLLVAHWLSAAAATTALLLPGSGDWFRAKREARAAAAA